jgi:hypothetical protein
MARIAGMRLVLPRSGSAVFRVCLEGAQSSVSPAVGWFHSTTSRERVDSRFGAKICPETYFFRPGWISET